MPPEPSSYAQWLADHREAAITRGAKPFSFTSPRSPEGHASWFEANKNDPELTHLQQDFANRSASKITGSTFADCLTVAKLAKELGMTTRALIAWLKVMGITQDILDWKEVPLVSAPGLTKCEYFHRSCLTPWAIEQGYGLSVPTPQPVRGRRRLDLELLTLDGQRYVKDRLSAAALPDLTAPREPVKLRDRIRAVRDSDPAMSAREIARRMGTTRQNVQYHLRRLAA